jgi:hypothetical protein
MATNGRTVTELGTMNVLIGGVALLGWLAVALLAVFDQLPHDWPETLRHASDVVFFLILLGGPACLPAGIGLLKRRRWARRLTMVLGGVAGVLAITGFALVCFGVLRTSGIGDFLNLSLFAAYSVGVFATLWNETSSQDAEADRPRE